MLAELPADAFAGMTQLESLNLEQTQLRNLILEYTFGESLRALKLLGNPLRCDCQARWLYEFAKNGEQLRNDTILNPKIELPTCSTPFIVKNRRLTTLTGKSV